MIDTHTHTWATQVHDLLLNIEKNSGNAPVHLILRHSQRDEPEVWDEIMFAQLTETGRAVAKDVGASLPKFNTYKFFHSSVERCEDTASQIAKGLLEINQDHSGFEMMDELWRVKVDKDSFLKIVNRDKMDFVKLWISSHYSPDDVEPALDYTKKFIKKMRKIHQSSQENTLNIYISHDFNILAFRFILTGLGVDENWLPYLGGFAISPQENHLDVYLGKEKQEIPLPHWW